MKVGLADFLRLGHVNRWNIVNTCKEQSVAEHSFLTTVIAVQLYRDMVGLDSDWETLQLVMGALFHDATEVRTGDIPTPGKRLLRPLIEVVEDQLMPEIPYVGGHPYHSLSHFIIMADLLEGAIWIGDNGAGIHANDVAMGLWSRVEDLLEQYTTVTGVDWYGPVNCVLAAVGIQPIAPRPGHEED